MISSLDILNSLRSVASTEYQARIPEATRDNIATIGNTIVGSNANTPFFNEFFSNLIQRIGRTIITSVESMDDVYSVFGEESMEMGSIVQEIFIKIPSAHAFKGTDTTEMLEQERGTIAVEYTSVDRKLYYKRTLTVEEIREAFTSVEKLNELVRAVIESMYTALAYDRYVMLTETLGQACQYVKQVRAKTTDNHIGLIEVPESVLKYNTKTKEMEWGSATSPKDFLKIIRIASRSLKFPHTIDVYNSTVDNKGVVTVGTKADTIEKQVTKLKDQVVALEVSTMASIDVDALAVLFHMDKADVDARQIEIQDGAFGVYGSGATSYYVAGFVCNKNAVKTVKTLEDADSFKNPQSKAVNYWLHFWASMKVSKFKDFLPIIVKCYTPA